MRASAPRTRVLVPLFVAVAAVSPTVADVLVTNLAEPLRATTEIGNNPNPTPPPSGATAWSWSAQSFVVDDATYALTRIDVIAGDAEGNPVVVAGLHADNAGAIGALITTLTASDLTGAQAPRSLTPDAPVMLAAGAIYWVVLGVEAPGDGTFGWSYANTNNSEGTGVIGAYADSQDSGANWNYGVDFPHFIQIVAEPAVTSCPGDINGDGVVDFADFSEVLANYGNTCE